jgi:D-amino-acid oxidase
VLDYEQIPTDSLKDGFQQGHNYTSVMVNVPMYLNYLLETAKTKGAIIIKAALPQFTTFPKTIQSAVDAVKSSNLTRQKSLQYQPS